MKTDAAIHDLESIHRKLLFSLMLPDAVLDPAAPAFVKTLDLAFARSLLGGDQPWGREDAFQESNRLIREVLTLSVEGHRLHLASEIDLLRKVKESGKDALHCGPFGISESVFPVTARGHVLHLVRTGKYRERPFTDGDIRDISALTGVPAGRVSEAAATLPVRDAAQAEQVATWCRRLRDALVVALEHHLTGGAPARPSLDSERAQALAATAQGMAHHINNLLSIILGYASLVADKAKLEGSPADAVKKIADAAQRGRRFTEEILAVAGGDEEEDAPVSVHERIHGVLNLLQGRMGGKIKVVSNLKAQRDIVTGPPGVVHQVVFNLMTNALDSMPTGGLLTVTTANGPDEADGRDLLQIEVTDSGGIPSSKAGQPGEGGAAVHGAPKLASALGLVGHLEGTVSVTSDVDAATRVRVTLPTSAKPEARPEKKVRRRLAPSRIWVADDDSVVREMCRRVLTEDGHTVEEVCSGLDAEKMIHKEGAAKPDLIVYDFNMPDYSGLEFCSALRDEGIRVPVLLLSGFKPDQRDISSALKLRKTFFLQKPFSFRDMSDMITVALGETLIGE
jgi:CheY-like chemotaxis protein